MIDADEVKKKGPFNEPKRGEAASVDALEEERDEGIKGMVF